MSTKTAAVPETAEAAPTGPVAVLDPKGRLRVPLEVWAALGLEPGVAAAWDVHLTPEGILLKPKDIDPDQWWAWTPEWFVSERELELARAGRRPGARVHASTDEFLAHLDALDAKERTDTDTDADADAR